MEGVMSRVWLIVIVVLGFAPAASARQTKEAAWKTSMQELAEPLQ